MEMAGLKTELFASGPYKAAGVPGVPLTDQQRAMIQARVDELAAIFKADVRRGRSNVSDDSMQGQTFLGGGGITAGLVDSVATFDKALSDARMIAAAR
jgi:ClpP class serine protease